MFLPLYHCHHGHTLFDVTPCPLEDSFRLMSAYAIERETTEARQAQNRRSVCEQELERIEVKQREYIG